MAQIILTIIISLFSVLSSYDYPRIKTSCPEQENITLQYQQFIREEAKEHRLFLEDSFDKMVLLISTGAFLFGTVLTWMNYKTKSEISKAVEDRFHKQINSLLGRRLKDLQNEFEAKNKDFEKRIAAADRLIMELSGRLSELNPEDIEHGGSLRNKPYNGGISVHRVLWVDDKPRNNDNIIDMFSERDISFDRVTSTDDAVKQLSKDDYSLIISDMKRGNSPDAGVKLLKIKNKRFPSIPLVIYSSSRSLAGYWQDAINEGADLVTTKTTELLGYIQKWLEKSK